MRELLIVIFACVVFGWIYNDTRTQLKQEQIRTNLIINYIEVAQAKGVLPKPAILEKLKDKDYGNN